MKYRDVLVVSLFILSSFGTGQAALIDQGITTLDTDSGLRWLDLTGTANRSFTDISGQLGLGGEFEGYRYASSAEVQSFIANAGIIGFQNGFNDFNFQPISDLLNLLGGPLSQSTFTTQSGGITSDISLPGLRNSINLIINESALTGATGTFSISLTQTFSSMGSWLVQPVPIPPTVWLFGSGLLGLIGIARK